MQRPRNKKKWSSWRDLLLQGSVTCMWMVAKCTKVQMASERGKKKKKQEGEKSQPRSESERRALFGVSFVFFFFLFCSPSPLFSFPPPFLHPHHLTPFLLFCLPFSFLFVLLFFLTTASLSFTSFIVRSLSHPFVRYFLSSLLVLLHLDNKKNNKAKKKPLLKGRSLPFLHHFSTKQKKKDNHPPKKTHHNMQQAVKTTPAENKASPPVSSEKPLKTTTTPVVQENKGSAVTSSKDRQSRRRSADNKDSDSPSSATMTTANHSATQSSSTTTTAATTTTTTTTEKAAAAAGTATTETTTGETVKRSSKKAGRSKKLVARRGPRRSGGEEAIELAVSSSDDDEDHRGGGRASSGSDTDDPDSEEEADLQIKKLALEKLSLERKDDRPPASKPTPSRKQQQQQQQGRNTPSQEGSSTLIQNRDSAPASPTPTPSSPAPSSSKKKRNRKNKNNNNQSTEQQENSQSQKPSTQAEAPTTSTTSTTTTVTPSSSTVPTAAPSHQSHQPSDAKPNSKANKRLSKQGSVSSPKSNAGSPSPAKELDLDSATENWGDSPMPEATTKVEPVSSETQPQRPNSNSNHTNHPHPAAHHGRPVSRGRGGRAAVEARVEYRKKLAEDPSFVPHLGEFWGHDDRYRGAGLKNFGDRGNFRGRFMGRCVVCFMFLLCVVIAFAFHTVCALKKGVLLCFPSPSELCGTDIKCSFFLYYFCLPRGGFARGGMVQGVPRTSFRNESEVGVNTESQQPESDDKEGASAKPKSDRWSHDGFDQLMKVQERSYRHQRNDSRPRSMHGKVRAMKYVLYCCRCVYTALEKSVPF